MRFTRRCAFAASVLMMALSISVAAAEDASTTPSLQYVFEQPFTPSYTDFGSTGLWQMPSARMQADGTLQTGLSYVWPYRRYTLSVQALPWLETNFRVTQVLNRIETGSLQFNREQDFFDRGIDFKARLLKESAYTPDLSIGIRDLGGTSLFSSEYIAASRRYYNTDYTLGLAWGNMGSRGGIDNPLGYLSDSYKSRGSTVQVGQFNYDFFKGQQVALYGGVEYVPEALPGWRLKLEYDGNNYKNEPLDNNLNTRTPLNFGVEYRPYDFWHLSVAAERGTRLMFRTSFAQTMDSKIIAPKIDEPPKQLRLSSAPDILPELKAAELDRPCAESATPDIRTVRLTSESRVLHIFSACTPSQAQYSAALNKALALQPHATPPLDVRLVHQGVAFEKQRFSVNEAADAAAVYARLKQQLVTQEKVAAPQQQNLIAALKKELDEYGISLLRFALMPPRATLYVRQARYSSMPKALGRTARAAFSALPLSITTVCVSFNAIGAVPRVSCVNRDAFSKLLAGEAGTAELLPQALLNEADIRRSEQAIKTASFPDFSWGIGPGYRQIIGGPDQYYAGQLFASLGADISFSEGTYIAANYGQDIVNNFDGLKLDGDSDLPPVRTNIQKYLKQGKSGLFFLNANHLEQLSSNWYSRVTGGILETMFSGYGGEVLYAPLDKRYAVAAEMYAVQQRGFKGDFELLDYKTTTGHVHLYYDVPYYDMLATLSVGRYLAGDDGFTVDVSRRFSSGIRAGIFATRTNVSAERFGEGGFDKGFYVSVPIDVFFVRERRGSRGLVYRPTTRDGGARLDNTAQLYPLIQEYKDAPLQRDWRSLKD